MPKRRKHPDAPKSAMGAYMWFCQDERLKVKNEMPGLGAKEILSELGKRWKDLTDADKVQYNNLAMEDKQRFEREKEKFLRTHVSLFEEDNGDGKKRRKKKKKKDPNAPKKPRTSYILFSTDVRAQVVEELTRQAQARGEDLKQPQIMSRVAEMWRNGDPATKERYAQLAAEEKENYEKRLQEYHQSLEAGNDMNGDDDDEDDDDDDDDDE